MVSVKVSSYRFGSVRIDGKTYRHDVLLIGDEILHPWERREGHSLHPDDLTWLITREPKTLIVGTGAFGRLRVPEETKAWLTKQGIELIALPTKEAIVEYNRRVAAGERAACGLHLTC
ncbi:hypothetical protein DRJ12_00140 [Candidatus Acetothermia bacterium]|nr:MAG: hypothetical protein DRJ12_00140 [Candidatus Acetothermia bacterium]